MSMFAFSGFNGFGQFGGDRQRSENTFIDISSEKLTNFQNGNLLVAVSWSYTAYATENQLVLRGFLSGKPKSTTCIRSADIITQLAACDKFCLALCENGKLFKVRPEIDGKLEEVKIDAEVQTLPQKRSIFGEPRPTPQRAERLHITHIACGSNITVAVSATNAVYSVPSKIHQFPKHFRVRQIQCGFEHALLLSANGDIYSWGNGFRGQLGQDVLRVEETPVLIEALAGVKINFVAAGGWHNAAISAFGDLYTWGFNSNGQLGLRIFKSTISGKLKEPAVFVLPQIVEIPACKCLRTKDVEEIDSAAQGEVVAAECVPVKVFAGARHTILQMNCGVLFAAGWNAHGQLGVGRQTEYCDEFEHITSIEGIVEGLGVFCGAWSTVIARKS
ncbi:RCC1 domain-containing protein 1 [Anastrepha obliqua]|uniref:RCC1 domain-containing protein 1 n=1 Tax=Anastrepha obliqua TaxID=95512 RepID=UPI00240A7E9D|nr:RCC1 domain-containing protein 1 [Anastrepha obliqua]